MSDFLDSAASDSGAFFVGRYIPLKIHCYISELDLVVEGVHFFLGCKFSGRPGLNKQFGQSPPQVRFDTLKDDACRATHLGRIN